jgi:hypothetical protein
MITRRHIMRVPFVAALPGALLAAPLWALWDKYAPRIVDAHGRVIDHAAGDRTTSEGQSYGLFFSLVAGDRERFEKILDWTQNNLSGGDLGARLPAWLYGRASGGMQSPFSMPIPPPTRIFGWPIRCCRRAASGRTAATRISACAWRRSSPNTRSGTFPV